MSRGQKMIVCVTNTSPHPTQKEIPRDKRWCFKVIITVAIGFVSRFSCAHQFNVWKDFPLKWCLYPAPHLFEMQIPCVWHEYFETGRNMWIISVVHGASSKNDDWFCRKFIQKIFLWKREGGNIVSTKGKRHSKRSLFNVYAICESIFSFSKQNLIMVRNIYHWEGVSSKIFPHRMFCISRLFYPSSTTREQF